ncbi:hypothetical protein [Rhizobium laguerreae]|uniref:hypothetical protein n=1 Tax=Rhizobium laguerreae TaxID=1076926 RepID=UPI0028A7DB5F|nr:hypothetical protein [Rhizobium laguerreae]
MNFVDNADVYGPDDNERIVREALYQYPTDLVIGRKGGIKARWAINTGKSRLGGRDGAERL